MSKLTEHLVLKEGDVFLFSHETGDISGNDGLGLYCNDLRYLSHFTFTVNDQPPSLLNFSGYQNFMGTLQFANELFVLPDGEAVMPQTISIRRSRFISEGLHERIGLANYNRFPVPMSVMLQFGSDFRDIFDVRGFPREIWGELPLPTWEDGILTLRYKAVDGGAHGTVISFDRPPDLVEIAPGAGSPKIEPGVLLPVVGAPSNHVIINPPLAALTWNFVLETNSPVALSLHIMPRSTHNEGSQPRWVGWNEESSPAGTAFPSSDSQFNKAVNYMRFSYWNWDTQSTRFSTDNEEFNTLLKRSKYDLRVLSDIEGDGYFPSAGIPWYVCPFGRDSLITALQTLALNPQLAVGTLRVLARHQGTREDPWREEQPGKILHELRKGEMARMGVVPHSPYYGSVDATPLFVMLFVETMRWLDDGSSDDTLALYNELLPHARRAIEWIDKYGDIDGDGLVEYAASTSHMGIRNQVWKDSMDSIQFPDNTLADTPIAAVEVQAYVYAARKGMAELLRRKGEGDEADRLDTQAARLKKKFNKAFWLPKERFLAQGLDKAKRPVPTITSNPAHCLWCGIVDDAKAKFVVGRLMQPDMVSGWGIRTISDKSPSYNPMSYHNGSVWPHDNSIIAAGFKRYGYQDEANLIITQVAEAAGHFRYSRLPELYCGFGRDKVYHSGPAEYPVSCSPQAWAAGASVLMLQSMLGLQADAPGQRIRINPKLPEWLNSVQLYNLRIGSKRIDLRVDRHDGRDDVHMAGGDSGIALEII